ncbi:MAG: radical SAM family heme chaperone HemW [Planctomycetes bacterium]|nr:radical SAM family heme chaperone HemW [Planctomycetota bacterium]
MPHNTLISLLQQRPGETSRPHFGSARGLVPVPDRPVRRLYIHVPFCSHKCHYCDFYSIVDTLDRQRAFTDRLIEELTALAPWSAGGSLCSVFVGGGTPTLLRTELWGELLAAIDRLFDLSTIRAGLGEFTVECNPESATEELFQTLVAGGVDRLSVGAQSFNSRHLHTLERRHDPVNVARALTLARQCGIKRTSIDLIYAVPGQTVDDWAADLGEALSLGVGHVSCYNLTYEPNTAMTKRLGRGDFDPIDEQTEIDMHTLAVATLGGAGLRRYEVSNFARPGQESDHNLGYWRQEQWLAAGPSASAHVAGHRWKNVPRLGDYLKIDDGGFAAIIDHEPPDAPRLLRERVMTGLRLTEGIEASPILEEVRTLGDAAAALSMERLAGVYVARGLMRAGDRWALTDGGFLLADGIAAEFMALIPEST